MSETGAGINPNNVNTRADGSNRILSDRKPSLLDRAKGALRGLAIAGVITGGVAADKATGSHVENAVTDTASAAVHAVEQFTGNDPKIEHVVKENVQVELLKSIHDNGVDKPIVIRTSPRADTIDNQLDEEKAKVFAGQQIRGNVILGGGWFPGAGADQSRWVHFKTRDEKGNEKDLYVASTFVNEIQDQTKP